MPASHKRIGRAKASSYRSHLPPNKSQTMVSTANESIYARDQRPSGGRDCILPCRRDACTIPQMGCFTRRSPPTPKPEAAEKTSNEAPLNVDIDEGVVSVNGVDLGRDLVDRNCYRNNFRWQMFLSEPMENVRNVLRSLGGGWFDRISAAKPRETSAVRYPAFPRLAP